MLSLFVLYRNIYLMCMGLSLTGLTMSLLIVPLIPELIKAAVERFGIAEDNPILCDRASAMSLTT
jgi:hypothetical protein